MDGDISTTHPALLIIDMQKGMEPSRTGTRNNPGAEDKIATLLAAWRGVQAPIVHVRHISREPGSPFRPGQDGVEFQLRFEPSNTEHIVEKHVPDAFVHSGLERWLRVRDIARVVIVGVSTNNSIEATARTAGNLGFDVFVVADATFAFDKADYAGRARTAEEVHDMSLANLRGEYAKVVETAEALRTL
jgi:nicotinamidase-related amidase